jgi:hypothetical protein
MKSKSAFITLLVMTLIAFWGCKNKTTVNPPSHAVMGISQDTLDYDSTKIEQDLTIYNTGEEILNWSFGTWPAWVTPSVSSGALVGSSSQIVALVLSRNLLAPGFNSGVVPLISSDDSLAVTVNAYQSSLPVLGQMLDSLDFGVSSDSMALTIRNTGGDTLHWTTVINPSQTAFSVSPASGSTADQTIIWVRFDRSDSTTALHQATLLVSSDGGSAQVLLSGYIGGIGGQWLSYSPNSTSYFDAQPLDLYFAVRFDRPEGWQNFKVSAIRANLYTLSGAYDDIQFFAWGLVSYQGYLYPDIQNALYQTPVIDPVSGWNEWVVDWPLTLSTFSVGYYQWNGDYPAYPQLWYDATVLAVRSYIFYQDPYGYVIGDILADRNWCLEVFVEPIYTGVTQPTPSEGRWLRPTKIAVESASPAERPAYIARMKLE